MSDAPRADGAWRRDLQALPAAARLPALLERVCRAAATFVGGTPVGAHTAWTAVGFDSLRAVEFRTLLAGELAVELRSTLLFDQPDPTRLCVHLLQQLGLAEPIGSAPAAATAAGSEAIAIVGAACRFPGGESLDAFARLLFAGGDAIAPIGNDRFDVEALYDPDPAAEGKLYVRHAGLLSEFDRFDAAFFGISPREAVMLDPQQRLLLEVAWHALEHANLPPAALRERTVGVYVGIRDSEYFASQTLRRPSDANAHYPTGNAASTAAGRLSYTFGFHGPCYALDTACSSSLVAVHVAVRALRARECDVALAGGVSALFDPVPMVGLCRARMLAPDGRSKAFAARADGYGRGEGCGIVVLKRLADAQAAGDRIVGVLRGTSINQDGRSSGLTVPNGSAQAAVIGAALTDAGLDAAAIDYVEAHGTGTPLGDPIEVTALQTAFAGRDRPLPIGSVKTNIGHLEAAAGVSGLLKTVLALQARQVPRMLHADEPTPHVDWSRSVVRLTTAPWPLPPHGPLHAGVSSFGFSGTNCHVVASSPPAPAPLPTPAPAAGPWLLALQAAEPAALRALARAHAQALAAGGVDVAAWCHALAVGRSALPVRAAFVGDDAAALARALHAFADEEPGAATAQGQARSPAPAVAFLFPGQGSQHAGMGRELHATEPAFRTALDRAAEVLRGHLPVPLHELLFGDATGHLDRTDATQPALCAYQVAWLALLREVGITPAAVLGHSVGDFAAAVAAGIMAEDDALRLCAARGRLMVERCRPGGMLAVLAPPERWRAALDREPELSIAVHNGPANVVVGGELAALDRFAAALHALGIAARRLPVSHAFHTARTEPMLAPFAAELATVPLHAPRLPFVDGRSGAFATAAVATAAHWCAHVRTPVQFAAGLATLARHGPTVWLELGARPLLAPLAAEHRQAGVDVLCCQSLDRPGRGSWLRTVAELWVRGVAVDLAAANHGHGPARVDLPLYPFQRRHCWLPKPPVRHAAATGSHALLGARVDSSLLAAGQSLFQAALQANSTRWLADHRVGDRVLLPATAMLEIALAADRALGAATPFVVHTIDLRRPLPLTGRATPIELLHTATPTGRRFELRALDADGSWREHCRGELGGSPAATATMDLTAIAARCPTPWSPATLYERAAALQLDYGPAFRAVQTVQIGRDEALATLRVADAAADPYQLHPVLLDAAFHTVVAVLATATTPWLPIGIEHVTVHRSGATAGHCHLRLRPSSGTGSGRIADIDLADAAGEPIATVRGLQLVPAPQQTAPAAAIDASLLHHVRFELAPAAPPGPLPSRLLLVADGAPGDLTHAVLGQLPAGHARRCGWTELPGALAAARTDHVVLFATDGNPAEPARTGIAQLAAVLAALRTALRSPKPPRPWLVTRGVQAAGPAPAGAPPLGAALLGIWRTLALEHPQLRPVAIDLDPQVPETAHAEHARGMLDELRTVGDEPEVALRSGQRRVRRLLPGPTATDTIRLPAEPFAIHARQYGGVEQLNAVALPARAPAAGEVQLRMLAVGLVWKDILYARGLLAEYAATRGIHAAEQQPLGCEGTGVVTAIGPGVSTPRLGDVVLVVGERCLASHVTVPATATCPLPPGLDAIAAAGAPTAFATVLHALADRAAVQPGETVLVHAAAGGVGQAAVQWLRWRGARVLATASAPKQALLRALGAEPVGDSRRVDFADRARAATGGVGVDVVLNTLGGESIAASLQALRVGGRFVELGKLGVWTAERVAAARPDVQFCTFDLADEVARDVQLLPRLLAQVACGLADGTFTPIAPTVLPMPQVRRAFAHFGRGQHVGKVVVQVPPPAAVAFGGERSWLITGASGGVGAAIADRLVAAGVRHLALLARGPIPAECLERLRARAVTVLPLAADVADRDAVAAALQQVRAQLPPLAGIVHAAGALDDGVLSRLDPERAAASAKPKLAGALWLDELTATDALTHFVLISSMAGTLGNPGQAAYAGANTFLDAFAAWRRARGRPATSIAFGPWAGAGMAARLDANQRRRLQQHGVQFLPAEPAADLVIDHASGEELAVLPVRWSEWLHPFGDAVPAPWRALRPAPATPREPSARLVLATLPAPARRDALRTALRAQIATVLGFREPTQLVTDRTFRELGLDSLLAVDAKDRIQTLLGQTLPATLLFDHPDLDRLTDHLLAANTTMEPAPGAATASAAADLADVDTATLARWLADELRDRGRTP